MGRANNLIAAAKAIASDNRNVYGKYPNNMGPYTWDCCTFLSKALYDCGIAPGEWYDNGYFWPHISEAGFDWFLLSVCGMTKLDYVGDGMLIPGDIMISRESYGHTAMFLGNWQMLEAHDQYPASEQIGIHELYEYDWAYVYRLPGEYEPDAPEYQEDCNLVLWKVIKGSEGGHVRTLQSLLNSKNNAGLLIDGQCGELTEAAIKDWQKKYGLTADGVCGQITWGDILCRDV